MRIYVPKMLEQTVPRVVRPQKMVMQKYRVGMNGEVVVDAFDYSVQHIEGRETRPWWR